MLLIRHLARMAWYLFRFAFTDGGGSASMLVLVGAPIVALVGVIKIAGIAALYPLL